MGSRAVRGWKRALEELGGDVEFDLLLVDDELSGLKDLGLIEQVRSIFIVGTCSRCVAGVASIRQIKPPAVSSRQFGEAKPIAFHLIVVTQFALQSEFNKEHPHPKDLKALSDMLSGNRKLELWTF